MSKNFAILRVGKVKSAVAVKGMLKHNFRDQETPNSDPELREQNIHLAAKSSDQGMKMYRDILPDKVRKNAVHAIDYLITTSPDSTAEDNAGAIKEAVDWIKEKHGAENIIMSSVHRDESTPHLHMLVVPIDEKGKLNARHFIGGTKHRMSEIQDEFYERLEEQGLNLNRGVKGSKANHKAIRNHYTDVAMLSGEVKAIEDLGAKKAGDMLVKASETLENMDIGEGDRKNTLKSLITKVADNGLPPEDITPQKKKEIDFD